MVAVNLKKIKTPETPEEFRASFINIMEVLKSGEEFFKDVKFYMGTWWFEKGKYPSAYLGCNSVGCASGHFENFLIKKGVIPPRLSFQFSRKNYHCDATVQMAVLLSVPRRRLTKEIFYGKYYYDDKKRERILFEDVTPKDILKKAKRIFKSCPIRDNSPITKEILKKRINKRYPGELIEVTVS